jgi:hypothetical protein
MEAEATSKDIMADDKTPSAANNPYTQTCVVVSGDTLSKDLSGQPRRVERPQQDFTWSEPAHSLTGQPV